MDTPSTVLQVALLILFVLPGISYQFVRERLRGAVAGERQVGERVLRAVTASILLDSLYAVIAGPALVRVVHRDDVSGWDAVRQQPRLVGLLALVLFIVIPSAAALLVSLWQRRRLNAAYRSTPTAWDHMFRSSRSCFVRARLKDGTWVGGWYGGRSYASSYPEPAEVFLESAWRMNPDGSFASRIAGTAGLYVRTADTDVIELLTAPSPAASSEDN
ncbi:DUF6338 family protein [Kribbella hippodromi]|uniref:DUF6338 family protein n=1 Tax=Kribbella hippodromi TaxID=434347 RepID=A0ABP4PLL9_9ACTN